MLYPQQKTAFAKRDTFQIAAAFGRLPAYWLSKSWLSSRNRYASNCVGRLNRDFTPGARVTHSHLSEYIAASAIIHAFDGWSYLGKAIHALLFGDHDSARHLGYYAELRAGMALLAANGIGIFDKEHVVVGAKGRCEQMPPLRDPSNPGRPKGSGTHKFVWDALEEWVKEPTSSAHVLGMISGGGSPIADWLRHIGTLPTFTTRLAVDWLLEWGLDIAQFADDRNARNISSYRPTALTTSRPIDARTTSVFVTEMWRLLEPSESNAFERLDRCLIRLMLRRAFKARFGHSPRRASKQFHRFVVSVLAGLQPASALGQNWETFLTEPARPALDIFSLASKTDGPEQSTHAFQVVSRALLLLRIATGGSQSLVASLPSTALADMEFWISATGEDRALWPANGRPEPLKDLWQDAEDAIVQFETNRPQTNSFSTFLRVLAPAACTLSTFERVGLWSLVA
jgi:hypothetical protein